MAVTRQENVYRITANADTISEAALICGVKVISSGANIVRLRQGDGASGAILWETSLSAAGEVYEEVKIKSRQGLYVEVSGAGTPVLYLYTG